ncbi:hypothetical protein GJ496_011525 [Pomphorhynchus laevis]|nr:hypothetical protein GJ496_011525 [Pomphorhynchus laevis]
MVKHCTDYISNSLFKSALWIERIIIPIHLCFGFPGNFMLYRVMQNTICRSMHMTVFFKAISITDSILLIVNFGKWLESLHVFNMNKLTNCGWVWGVVYAAHSISNWLLMLLNFDRALFVIRNDLSRRYFNKRNCKIMCLVISIVLSTYMLQLPIFLRYNASNYHFSGTPCVYKHYARNWGRIGWPIIYNVFFLAIPYTGILSCSIYLLHYVNRSKRKVGGKSRKDEEQSLRSTVLISLIYIVCAVPFGFVLNFTAAVINKSSCHLQSFWILMNIGLMQLSAVNHSMKFYLIASQTKIIRNNLMKILKNEDISVSSERPV